LHTCIGKDGFLCVLRVLSVSSVVILLVSLATSGQCCWLVPGTASVCNEPVIMARKSVEAYCASWSVWIGVN